MPRVPLRSGFEYNTSYEATVSGPAPEVGTVPRKPSDDTKSKKSFGHSKAQSAGLQEFRTLVDNDIHSRAKSTGGIQPILVGISRPVPSGDRQKHVTEAGNVNVKPAPTPVVSRLNTAASLPEQRKAQKSPMPPRRHVDIMSFAAATGNHLEGYNEEVAARNLDLKALARESAITTSVPKSKYQEEVASRNAVSMAYRYKPSAPMQSVPEDRRSNSLNSKAARSTSTSATLPAYKHEGVILPAKARSVQDSAAYHSRNGSATSKSSNQLPAIPQELSVEEAERAIPWLQNQKQPEVTQRSDESADPGTAVTRYPSMHVYKVFGSSNQTASLPPLPKMTTRANESRPIANSNPREHGHPLYSNPYEAPVVEYVDSGKQTSETRYDQASTRRMASKSSQYRGDDFSRRTGISSSRTSSADRGRPTSSLNHRRDMSNRTIMDLTEDEPEKQGQHESPNTDYLESPVLAQVTADMLQLRRAQDIGLDSSQYENVTTPWDTTDYGTPSARSLIAPSRHLKRWSGAVSDTGSIRSEQALAFSAVTTVSSMSPASQSMSRSGPQSESSRTAMSRERKSQGLTSRIAPVPDIDRPGPIDESAEKRLPTTLDPLENSKAPAFYVDTPPNAYNRQQNQLAAQTPKVLYTSPESLSSSDFINPSRAFGVMTRDFASTPSRQSTIRQQAPRQTSQPTVAQAQNATPRQHLGFEHKSKGVPSNIREISVVNEPSRSSQLDHVDTPFKELTASSFDEAEFARKQAQARAALLRLQMSLEEQYDMSPGRPDSSAQRHVARQILDQTRKPQLEEKKKSAPPTSMYYEKKDYQNKVKANRPAPIRTPSEDTIKAGSGYGYEKQGPNSFAQSVYSAVTVAPPTTTRPAVNGHTKSSSAGSASHSYNYAVGAGSNGAPRGASTLPNPPLTPVLPSPSGTEVSLSSFPMPAPQSPEERGRNSATEPDRPRTARMHSTKSSVASIASVYSIPHHMVPARDSSRRDQFEEEVEAW